MKKGRKFFIAVLLLVATVFLNGIYFVFSGQRRAVEKIDGGGRLNLYEYCSVYTMHMALWLLGWPMSPTAAYECMTLHFPHKQDTITIRNERRRRSLLSPKVVAAIHSLEKKPVGAKIRVTWNGNEAYSRSSPEHVAAIAVNPCTIIKASYLDDGMSLYTIRSEMLYPVHSVTRIDIGPFSVPLQEGLFRHLQDRGWLSCYVAEYGIPECWLPDAGPCTF